jgi:hypothetical protein
MISSYTVQSGVVGSAGARAALMRKSARFRSRVRGRIFISYRHDETAYLAQWLFARLTECVGSGRVFKDVNTLIPGDKYPKLINQAVASCDVLLALIGEHWLTVTDENRKRRLEDPKDWVRLEIEAALARKIRVIPILADKARMPRADELPASLVDLAYRHAQELNSVRLDYDTSQLLNALNIIPTEPRTAQPGLAPSPVLLRKRPETRYRVELISRSYCEIFLRLHCGSRQYFITFARGRGNDVISVDGSLVKQGATPLVNPSFLIADGNKRIPVVIKEIKTRGQAVRDSFLYPAKIGSIRIFVDKILVYEELYCCYQYPALEIPARPLGGATAGMHDHRERLLKAAFQKSCS